MRGAPRALSLKAGTRLGPYEILSALGTGGMGEVYRARDTKLGRDVALKVLPDLLANDPERRARFQDEAQVFASLNHPNIAHIYEIAESDGVHFIAMEFIDGETLRNSMRHAPITLDHVLDVIIQSATALSAAHAAGIVHRDIKPENIMLRRDGIVKVLDFGLAKFTERPPPEFVDTGAPTRASINTEQGVVMGTVTYMSPEQARGLRVDARTDIFSLGVLSYEMVASRLPFEGSNTNEILASILSDKEPWPLARYAPQVPAELQRIVSKALRKNRDERYQTMKDLLLDLKTLGRELEFERKAEATTSVNIALAALIIIGLATGAYVYFSDARRGAITSVAVMPFTNVTSDPDTEYLSDGITDNIIDRLSRLPGLKVMSHTAVFHYKGKETDARAIGRELGVEAVLAGRLVKRSDAFTINLELVNARDNSRIWGEQYERKVSDLVAVQREIPVDVSDNLRLRLSGESKERLTSAYTDNREAYQLYLKGRYSWEKWTRDGAKQAVEFFEEAIKKDPSYALAYSGLAEVYLNFGAGVGPDVPQKEAHRRAREAATKALSIDPQLGEAHAALAEVLLFEWNFAGAEREFKRAIELSPSNPEGHHEYSHLLLLLGRIEESFDESKKLLEVDPVSETPIGHLGYHYLYARQYDEAIAQLQKDIQQYPDSTARFNLGDAYYHVS